MAVAALLGGSAWLYVRNGDSFLSVSGSSLRSTSHSPRTHAEQDSGGRAVGFTGNSAAAELPCAIRREDVRKVLAYLAARGEKSRGDLAEVCKDYGVTVTAATS